MAVGGVVAGNAAGYEAECEVVWAFAGAVG